MSFFANKRHIASVWKLIQIFLVLNKSNEIVFYTLCLSNLQNDVCVTCSGVDLLELQWLKNASGDLLIGYDLIVAYFTRIPTTSFVVPF